MFNKSIITILLIMISLFLIALYALLMQVFGIESGEKATIISGFLSMVGGLAGALGAYFVATNQMKKQFQKQDKDRVIELRIEKLNETLGITNEFLHVLQNWHDMTVNVNAKVKECIDKHFTHIAEVNVFQDIKLTDIKSITIKLVSLKDSLKKNKIFLTEITNLEKIEKLTIDVDESNKKLVELFTNFKTNNSITVSVLEKPFNEVIDEVTSSYKNLDNEIDNIINLIENRIIKLLNLN